MGPLIEASDLELDQEIIKMKILMQFHIHSIQTVTNRMSTVKC